jgi:hypothetical protein
MTPTTMTTDRSGRLLWPVCRRAVTGVVAAVLAATAILAVACGASDDRRPVTLAPADMRLVATSLPPTTLVGPPGVAVGLLDRSRLDVTQRASRSAATPRPQPAVRARAATRTTRGLPLASSGDVWGRLAQCESGGNWATNTGNGFYGGLQFSLSSWHAVGGVGYPHQASAAVQIEMGRRLLARQGWGAWPACSRRLGLR